MLLSAVSIMLATYCNIDFSKYISTYINEDVRGLLISICEWLYAKSEDVKFDGRNRVTFIRKSYVIKVPATIDGFADNDWEGSVSNTKESLNNPEEIEYAKSRLVEYKGIPLVFMERVEEAYHHEITSRLGYYPDWVLSVDCQQVGFTKSGRLVAYDFGLH